MIKDGTVKINPIYQKEWFIRNYTNVSLTTASNIDLSQQINKMYLR